MQDTVTKRRHTPQIVSLLLLGITVITTGCSSTSHVPQWITGDQCPSIGCGKNLEFYPNEVGGAARQAKDFYDFEWGKTSSAYPPSDPKHWELKEKEIAAGQTPWHWNQ